MTWYAVITVLSCRDCDMLGQRRRQPTVAVAARQPYPGGTDDSCSTRIARVFRARSVVAPGLLDRIIMRDAGARTIHAAVTSVMLLMPLPWAWLNMPSHRAGARPPSARLRLVGANAHCISPARATCLTPAPAGACAHAVRASRAPTPRQQALRRSRPRRRHGLRPRVGESLAQAQRPRGRSVAFPWARTIRARRPPRATR